MAVVLAGAFAVAFVVVLAVDLAAVLAGAFAVALVA